MSDIQFNMLYQIGLNHIFDDGTICFCLVCKDSITENYPLDRDKAISEHFRSEDHEESSRNLFKICIPDPKCESRDVKYLDIVNNSAVEVLEQGNKPSYISKNDNHFVCLVCQEEVSKVCGEAKKIKNNLQDHLESELHIDNVRNSFWWIYYPNVDTNYIALNTVFMYCSLCQQILESEKNSLLEFAADHIETEHKMVYYDKTLQTKQKAINSDNGLKIELEDTDSDDVSKTEFEEANVDSPLKTEFEDTNLNQILYTQFEPDTKPNSCQSEPIIKNIQTTIIHSNNQCKSLVESEKNSLLEFVADHIETEHKRLYYAKQKAINSDNALKIELEDTDSDVSKTELEEANVDSPLKTEFEDTNLNQILYRQFEPDTKPNSCQSEPIIENIQTTIKHSNNQCESLCGGLGKASSVKFACSEVNLSQIFDELKSVCKILDLESLDSCHASDNINADVIKEEVIICPECQEQVEISNNDVPFSMQKHSQKHKDLSFIYDDIELEIQGKVDCYLCHNQIEIFNKDRVLSYKVHFENCHTDSEISLVNIENTNNNHSKDQEYLEESDIVVKAISLLPVGLRDQINFIAIVGDNLKCILCNYEFPASNDITLVFHVLKNHFSEFYHKSQYEVCLQNDIDNVEDELEFEENSQLFKGLQFNRSSPNEMISQGKSITLKQYNTNKSKNEIGVGKVRSRFEVLEILYRLVNVDPSLEENLPMLDEKEGHFYCQLCDETLTCTLSGTELIKHLKRECHSTRLSKNQIKGKVRKHADVLNILRELSRCNKLIKQNIEDIGEKNGHFFCKLCDEIIMCTLSGKKLVDHLNGLNHSLQMEKLEKEQRELMSKARPSHQVYNILWHLASFESEVNENIEILKEKQGHFYCETCDEILLCTCSGSKLIVHLRSKKHMFNLFSYTKKNLK